MPDHGGWRSADASGYLKHAQRLGLAWEFLRRNSDYRRDF
ncbi:MAG: transcriptional regulator domain-containing protein, partial [Afipia sp.]